MDSEVLWWNTTLKQNKDFKKKTKGNLNSYFHNIVFDMSTVAWY